MLTLALGLGLFFGTHLFSALRSRDPEKDIMKKIGRGPYMGVYSLVALAGFILIVYGFANAPRDTFVYVPPVWGRHAAHGIMLVALILLVATYTPTGHIKRAVGHPMITAVALWAAAHLLTNGDLASLLLFGAFLAFTLFDRVMVTFRPAGEAISPSIRGDVMAIAIGAVVFAAIFFGGHQLITGVPVM